VVVGIGTGSLGGGRHNLLGGTVLNVRLHSGRGESQVKLESMGL